MKTPMKILGIIVSLAALGMVMAYLAGVFETKIAVDSPVQEESTGKIETHVVADTEEPLLEQAVGTLRAKVETVISPIITASIVSIAVRSGDEVQKGDLLVELDARELDARAAQSRQIVRAAEAKLAQVEKDFQRIRRIRKADPGAVSKAEYDRAYMTLQTGRAERTQARRLLDQNLASRSYGRIVSPISGRVIERYADPGDTARQGEQILRLYDPGSLRLEARVRESVASSLRKGQPLTIKVDASRKMVETLVEEIVPSADPGSRTFLVKTSLKDNENLYPGMFGRLLIPLDRVIKRYIPAQAVTRMGQLSYVRVLTDHGPVRRYVRLGADRDDGQIEVFSGLKPGEKILVTDNS